MMVDGITEWRFNLERRWDRESPGSTRPTAAGSLAEPEVVIDGGRVAVDFFRLLLSRPALSVVFISRLCNNKINDR